MMISRRPGGARSYFEFGIREAKAIAANGFPIPSNKMGGLIKSIPSSFEKLRQIVRPGYEPQ
jgi:hypothetical protein